eukprot:4193388-Prymnesium_polylepis.1
MPRDFIEGVGSLLAKRRQRLDKMVHAKILHDHDSDVDRAWLVDMVVLVRSVKKLLRYPGIASPNNQTSQPQTIKV